MCIEFLQFIFKLVFILLIIFIGWYIIWVNILIHVPIVRAISGLEDVTQKKTIIKIDLDHLN
jgi:hypothetical protein